MAEGLGLQLAQATVVVQVLDDLPDSPGSGAPGAGRDRDGHPVRPVPRPFQLRRLGRHLLEVVAPEIAEAEEAKRLQNQEQRAREKTSLRTRHHRRRPLARTTIVHPVPDRERLLTYLESYTSPRKHPVRDQWRGRPDPPPPTPRPSLRCPVGTPRPEHLLPAHGGDATTLMVTIDLNSLTSELGTGAVVGGEPLSATEIRRLACEAAIIPVALGGNGEILDRGRTRRLYSVCPAQSPATQGPTLPRRRLHHPRRLVRSPPPETLDRRREDRPRPRRPRLQLPPPPPPRPTTQPRAPPQRRPPLPPTPIDRTPARPTCPLLPTSGRPSVQARPQDSLPSVGPQVEQATTEAPWLSHVCPTNRCEGLRRSESVKSSSGVERGERHEDPAPGSRTRDDRRHLRDGWHRGRARLRVHWRQFGRLRGL